MIIFEDDGWRNFLPLVYWRPVFRLRCGRWPLMERIAGRLGSELTGLWVRDDIAAVARVRHGLPVNCPPTNGTLLVNARWIPDGPPASTTAPVVGLIDDDIAFVRCDAALADRLSAAVVLDHNRLAEALRSIPRVQANGMMLRYPWDLIAHNGPLLLTDWRPDDAGIVGDVQPGAHITDPRRVHLARGSVLKPGAVLDPAEGPIYIAEHVTVMPNAVIEGPAYVGERSVICPGCWLRSNVSIGPDCKIGGEVGASIFHALSNKQHHGFVGHSYIAEWVNLGAGTTTSNLKNTYGEIKMPLCGVPIPTGQTFLGAVIGDFVKTGINQALATGSVIGFSTNLATSKPSPQFIPSFRFLTDERDEPYDPVRGLEVARRAMSRRSAALSSEEEAYFRQLPLLAARCECL